MQPSFETLRDLIAACGFELSVAIGPRAYDEAEDAELRSNLRLSPQERLQERLRASAE